jgi:hypothetical protein
LNVGFLIKNAFLTEALQSSSSFRRQLSFHYRPGFKVELQKPPAVFKDMNMPRVVIRRVQDNDHATTFPAAHEYMYPELITLVNGARFDLGAWFDPLAADARKRMASRKHERAPTAIHSPPTPA